MPEINPALAALEPLVGRWRMELHGASFLPDRETRLTGSVDIGWIEAGAALRIQQNDPTHPPAAVWIIGRDEAADTYSVLYADDRGVSRIYGMSLGDGRWEIARTTPEFSQRFSAEVDPDGERISGRWEKSLDGGTTWEHDFYLDYLREAGEPR